MDYLAICKRVVRESRTMSGTGPSAVTSQTGRYQKVVDWVASAWTDVQNKHSTWKWMRAEFTGTLSANTPNYTAASFNLTRWRYWITEPRSLTMYLTATGVSDEGPLACIPWTDWRERYGRGTQTANRPIEYAVSPSGELYFGPKPDYTYTVKGEYQKSPQTLEADADTPEMPSQFHMLVVWMALMYLDEHDEANVSKAQRRRQDVERDLEREQLPPLVDGSEALA